MSICYSGWGVRAFLGVAGLAFIFLSGAQAGQRQILALTSSEGQASPVVDGPAEWVDQGQCAASTFKVFLSWVALEEGLAGPGTRLTSADKHVPGTPRPITLHQAMYYSSNDYFLKLFEKVPQQKIDAYLLRTGLAGEKVPANWRTPERALASGGTLKISPRMNHEFMRRIAFGKLASTPAVQAALESVLRWPGPAARAGQPPPPVFYGKTGTFSGAVWFNGFADDGKRRVCTVYLPGTVDQRMDAISRFYQTWKVAWDPGWQEWLEQGSPPR